MGAARPYLGRAAPFFSGYAPWFTRPEYSMQAFAQTLDLVDDPERIAEYDAYHAEVWPEVVAGLKSIGINRMQLYRTGTRLFMYCEAGEEFDPERDYQTYATDPRCREWDQLMRGYQQRIPTAGDTGEWWTPMELIFELDSANS